MKTNEYEQVLLEAIESLNNGRISDAELQLSNYFSKQGRSKAHNYLKLLKWTVTSTSYIAAINSVQSRIARFYYFVNNVNKIDNVNNESNPVFVKRTANGYEILEQMHSR